ncbi:MAG: putative entry exclusion protein TrbK-alt [Sphingomonas bacterium]
MSTLTRIGAIAFAAIAITMTAIEMRDAGNPAPEHAAAVPIANDADPLHGELIRCQMIGQAGASDSDCLRAWAENRRRFLAPGARPQQRLPDQAEAAAEVARQARREPVATTSTAPILETER